MTGTRVYCSNVGDSRCIMLRACDLKEALNKSGINNNNSLSPPTVTGQTGQAHGEFMDPTTQLSPPLAVSGTTSSTPSTTPRTRTFGSFSMSSASASSSHSGKANTVQYTTVVHLMSEDHKLSVLRERMRVKTRTPVP